MIQLDVTTIIILVLAGWLGVHLARAAWAFLEDGHRPTRGPWE